MSNKKNNAACKKSKHYKHDVALIAALSKSKYPHPSCSMSLGYSLSNDLATMGKVGVFAPYSLKEIAKCYADICRNIPAKQHGMIKMSQQKTIASKGVDSVANIKYPVEIKIPFFAPSPGLSSTTHSKESGSKKFVDSSDYSATVNLR